MHIFRCLYLIFLYLISAHVIFYTQFFIFYSCCGVYVYMLYCYILYVHIFYYCILYFCNYIFSLYFMFIVYIVYALFCNCVFLQVVVLLFCRQRTTTRKEQSCSTKAKAALIGSFACDMTMMQHQEKGQSLSRSYRSPKAMHGDRSSAPKSSPSSRTCSPGMQRAS